MSNIYVGMDVHQCSITLAVLPVGAAAPTAVEQVPNEPGPLRRRLARLAEAGPLQVCYEASAAGFVLHRALTAWGHACTVIAPALIPTKPGIQRKHDRYDAVQLARLFRAGMLWTLRHLAWFGALTRDSSPLTGDDRETFAGYWALFQYKRERRLVLDRRLAEGAADGLPGARAREHSSGGRSRSGERGRRALGPG